MGPRGLRSQRPAMLGPRSAVAMPRHTTRMIGCRVTGVPLCSGACGSAGRPEMRMRVMSIGPCTGLPAIRDALHTAPAGELRSDRAIRTSVPAGVGVGASGNSGVDAWTSAAVQEGGRQLVDGG